MFYNIVCIVFGLLLVGFGIFNSINSNTKTNDSTEIVHTINYLPLDIESINSIWISDLNYKRMKEYVSDHPESRLYVIQLYKDNEVFYKVGVTSKSIAQRFGDIPYNYKVLYESPLQDSNLTIYQEALLKHVLKFNKYSPHLYMSGCKTECFDSILEQKNIDMLINISKENYLYKDQLSKYLRF